MAKRKPLPTEREIELGAYPHSELIPMLEAMGCDISDSARAAILSPEFASQMGFGTKELVRVSAHRLATSLQNGETFSDLCAKMKRNYGLVPCPTDVATTLLFEGSPLLENTSIYVVCVPIKVDGDPRIFSIGISQAILAGSGDLVYQANIESDRCEPIHYLSFEMDMLFVRE